MPVKKPFPWTCGNCAKQAVFPATFAHTAEIRQDGLLHKVEIPESQAKKFRACGEESFGLEADDQIDRALRVKLGFLSPEEILHARKDVLGLTQPQLAERLGVAEATISRWENSAVIQSRAMDRYLRAFFAVPAVRSFLAQGTPLQQMVGN